MPTTLEDVMSEAKAKDIAKIRNEVRVAEHGDAKACHIALDGFTGKKCEDLHSLLTSTNSLSRKMSSVSRRTLMPIAASEPTEEDEERAAEALTVVDIGKDLHQDGQVCHIRLPIDGQACGEERLKQEVIGAVDVRGWRCQVYLCSWSRTELSSQLQDRRHQRRPEDRV